MGGMEHGMEQLNILRTKCKTILFDMGIFTTSLFMSTEVGELATNIKHGISKWQNKIKV
jgi:hypothetical protein